MKLLLTFLSLSILLLSACSSDDNSKGDSDDTKKVTCQEQNSVSFNNLQGIDLNGEDFKVVKAWRGGWSFGSEKMKFNVWIAFARKEFKVSTFGPEIPEDDYVVMLQINSEMFKTGGDQIELKEGAYPAGSSGDDQASAQAQIFDKRRSTTHFSQGLTGSAEITHLSETNVCGNANFIDKDGNEMKLSFSTEILMDQFDNVRGK